MSITQPGDVTVIAPISVPNDANFAMRAESVSGGFIAVPSGNGPPTTTNVPMVVRRVGTLVYTPGDNKFWQLIGGVLDADWVEAVFGGGGGGGSGLVVAGTPADQWVVTWNASVPQAEWQPAGGLQVLSFSPAVGLYECGQSVVNPAFIASYSATPAAALLTNDANAESKDVHTTPTSFTSSQTYVKSTPNQSVTWTLTTSNGTRTTSSIWGQKNFWGISTAPANTEAFIEALAGSQLTTSRNAAFTVNATGSNKIYFACPSRYGTPTFTVGGFVGGFILRGASISVTNAQGFTENYDLYESVNPGLGTTNVTVS
jgi:hypothetical protein